MILLLGGTSETGQIARRLIAAGAHVLVSTATDEPLDIGNAMRHVGRLDLDAMVRLIRQQHIRVLVDATHPYAATARATAAAAAAKAGIPYLTLIRPSADMHGANVHTVPDHAAAAKLAFSFGQPVLLTTGANNLAPYAAESRRTAIPLIVRVLPRYESLKACAAAGIPAGHVIAAKGPFTLDQNLAHIRRFNIGVLVTKDSGEAGGVPEKIAAAREAGCQVVLVSRPQVPRQGLCHSLDELIRQATA